MCVLRIYRYKSNMPANLINTSNTFSSSNSRKLDLRSINALSLNTHRNSFSGGQKKKSKLKYHTLRTKFMSAGFIGAAINLSATSEGDNLPIGSTVSSLI